MTSKRNLKTTSKKDEDNLKIFKKRVTLKNKMVKKPKKNEDDLKKDNLKNQTTLIIVN